MRTAPQGDDRLLRVVPDGPTTSRRLVAVAVSAVDLLHPGSDLRHVADTASEVDVLVARVDRPGARRRPLPLEAPDYPEDGWSPGPGVVDGVLAGFTVPLPPHAAAPHLPASLHLHRLDLQWPVRDDDVPDLVAALSELIGFDPDDEVFCVSPATGPAGAPDPEQEAVDRAVRRVARVYGLPVLHYRRPADAIAGVPVGMDAVVPQP